MDAAPGSRVLQEELTMPRLERAREILKRTSPPRFQGVDALVPREFCFRHLHMQCEGGVADSIVQHVGRSGHAAPDGHIALPMLIGTNSCALRAGTPTQAFECSPLGSTSRGLVSVKNAARTCRRSGGRCLQADDLDNSIE